MGNIFSSILVPFDGSRIGKKALNVAIKLASEINSSVIILGCIREEQTLGFFKTKSNKRKTIKKKELIRADIQKFKENAKKIGVTLKASVSICVLASKHVVSYANDHDIDLIILKKSKTILEEDMYHESSVDYIEKNASCSVLIVK